MNTSPNGAATHTPASVVTARTLGRDPVLWLAFGLGSGLARRAPGTVGTLAALPMAWWLMHWSPPWQALWIVVTALSGIWICGQACTRLGVHDHGGVVWDEFVGLWLTVVWFAPSLSSLVLGFALFRLFDIWKPWPIGWLDEKVQGGLGVMVDDLLAGLMAAVVLAVLLWLL